MIGIDGCRAGWCIAQGDHDNLEIKLLSHISEVSSCRKDNELILIDMPIGLADHDHERIVEQAARGVIPYQSSSVFSVPCREAVYAADYKNANVLNRKIEGKGLSIQAWNICPKIKEIDSWLTQPEIDSTCLTESHPELCFHMLQKNPSKLPSKKSKEGISERLAILEFWHAGITDIYHQAVAKYMRKEVQKDDIVDALCLWCIGSLSQKYGLESLVDTKYDKSGFVMNMFFTNPHGHPLL